MSNTIMTTVKETCQYQCKFDRCLNFTNEKKDFIEYDVLLPIRKCHISKKFLVNLYIIWCHIGLTYALKLMHSNFYCCARSCSLILIFIVRYVTFELLFSMKKNNLQFVHRINDLPDMDLRWRGKHLVLLFVFLTLLFFLTRCLQFTILSTYDHKI